MILPAKIAIKPHTASYFHIFFQKKNDFLDSLDITLDILELLDSLDCLDSLELLVPLGVLNGQHREVVALLGSTDELMDGRCNLRDERFGRHRPLADALVQTADAELGM